jgi:hypothetical protein
MRVLHVQRSSDLLSAAATTSAAAATAVTTACSSIVFTYVVCSTCAGVYIVQRLRKYQ